MEIDFSGSAILHLQLEIHSFQKKVSVCNQIGYYGKLQLHLVPLIFLMFVLLLAGLVRDDVGIGMIQDPAALPGSLTTVLAQTTKELQAAFACRFFSHTWTTAAFCDTLILQ